MRIFFVFFILFLIFSRFFLIFSRVIIPVSSLLPLFSPGFSGFCILRKWQQEKNVRACAAFLGVADTEKIARMELCLGIASRLGTARRDLGKANDHLSIWPMCEKPMHQKYSQGDEPLGLEKHSKAQEFSADPKAVIPYEEN